MYSFYICSQKVDKQQQQQQLKSSSQLNNFIVHMPNLLRELITPLLCLVEIKSKYIYMIMEYNYEMTTSHHTASNHKRKF